MQIVCGNVSNPCGFRVHDRYYSDKPRFARGICARCQSPLRIVHDDTNDLVDNAIMDKSDGLVVVAPGGGALQQVSIAAATAVVNYDLLTDAIFQTDGRSRRIVAAGLAGSAAALDTIVRLMAGTRQIGTIYNAATGAVTRDSMFRIGEDIPPNTPIHAYVVDAPATNPINLALDII